MISTPSLESYCHSYSYPLGKPVRVGTRGPKATQHLQRALAEVDGLFAGFQYLDETEPESHVSSARVYHQDALVLELDALCTEVPVLNAPNTNIYDDNTHTHTHTREIAWTSIRTVRDGMQVIWDHFVALSHTLNAPAINKIRDDYQDAKGLRHAGVFAFRNTLTGPTPNDLGKIFAFCSLSYVVSRLLHAKGRLAEDDILAGVRSWLDALEEESERTVFNIIAHHLWPEARGHLRFSFTGGEQRTYQADGQQGGLDAPSITTNPAFASSVASYQLSSNQHRPYQPSFNELIATEDLNARSAILGVNPPSVAEGGPEGPFAHAVNVAGLSYDSFYWHDFEPPQPYMDTNTEPQMWPDSALTQSLRFDPMTTLDFVAAGNTTDQPSIDSLPSATYDSGKHNRSSPGIQSGNNTLDNLQETSVFTAVVEYFRECCNFWFELADRGSVSKDLRSCLSWSQENLARKRHIQKSYMQPLLSKKCGQNSTSRGIISIAEAFVEWGFLQSIYDIEDYMKCAARLLFDDLAAREEFRRWLHGFRECPQSPDPVHEEPKERA
ncbi:hypothetical protein FHETE_3693 [Fusarium heterosporum]|uniref:Uncharacterized protein n=1 Tax=Fusarium heterosporum TaxID=42747 RepID=A0A8H5WWF6_FUSHE|nr:hypothetical protein FHETE_3693 [Fusarium heterosporum]